MLLLTACLALLLLGAACGENVVGDVGRNYSTYSVNAQREYTFLFDIPHNQSDFLGKYTTPIRVTVESVDGTEGSPLQVVVSQLKRVMSWEVPHVVYTDTGKNDEYRRTSRTLCPHYHDEATRTKRGPAEKIIVSVSTMASENLRFSLLVEKVEDFFVSTGDERNLTGTPSEPVFYKYLWPSNHTGVNKSSTPVLLRVDSSSDACMVVSVQGTCPGFEIERSVQFEGKRQTVSHRGGFTITKSAFPNGFFVLFVVKDTDSDCSDSPTHLGVRSKDVTFSMTASISREDYEWTIGWTCAVVLCFCLVFAAILVCIATSCLQQECGMSGCLSRCRDGIKDLLCEGESPAADERSQTSGVSMMYMWNVFLVGLFYVLPVLQLIYLLQWVFLGTGDADVCYYNYLCATPISVVYDFYDFNHCFSNIGYIVLGLFFMIIVKCREMRSEPGKENTAEERTPGTTKMRRGLPYAMGAALVMEGVLSACYHICPSALNFQFDLTFMYLIVLLSVLKLHSIWRPHLNERAYHVFAYFFALTAFACLGILLPGWTVKVLFTMFNIFGTAVYIWRRIKEHKLMIDKKLAWWLVIVDVLPLILNGGLLVYFWMDGWDLGTIILYLLGGCLLSSLIFPVIMLSWGLGKFCCQKCPSQVWKERSMCRQLETLLYFLIAIGFGCWAYAYFKPSKVTSWEGKPAESRNFNQLCLHFHFYDSHDMWHFLSALAVFFLYMGLFTFDGDFIKTEENSSGDAEGKEAGPGPVDDRRLPTEGRKGRKRTPPAEGEGEGETC